MKPKLLRNRTHGEVSQERLAEKAAEHTQLRQERIRQALAIDRPHLDAPDLESHIGDPNDFRKMQNFRRFLGLEIAGSNGQRPRQEAPRLFSDIVPSDNVQSIHALHDPEQLNKIVSQVPHIGRVAISVDAPTGVAQDIPVHHDVSDRPQDPLSAQAS